AVRRHGHQMAVAAEVERHGLGAGLRAHAARTGPLGAILVHQAGFPHPARGAAWTSAIDIRLAWARQPIVAGAGGIADTAGTLAVRAIGVLLAEVSLAAWCAHWTAAVEV